MNADTTSITVGLAGDPSNYAAGLQSPDDFEMPWADREKVELEVAEDETLRSVLERAGNTFGASTPGWTGPRFTDEIYFIDFYREGQRVQLRREVALVDDQERVYWTHGWMDLPYREFRRAGEAGTLDGDPRRPYLLLQPGIGNGVLVDLSMLIELWQLFWTTLDFLWTDAGDEVLKGWGLYEIARRLRKSRARRAPDVVHEHREDWREREVRPGNLMALVRQHPWTAEQIARLLDCSTDETEVLLIGYGCEQGEDDRWRIGESEEAKFLADTIELLIHSPGANRDALRELLIERLKEFGKTARAPEIDWQRVVNLPHDPEAFGRLEVIQKAEENEARRQATAAERHKEEPHPRAAKSAGGLLNDLANRIRHVARRFRR